MAAEGDAAAAGSAEKPTQEPSPSQERIPTTSASASASASAGRVNWGTATLVAVFAGLLYGGSKEAAASVSKDAEVMLKLGSTPDKREQYRLMRDAMEKRFIRVARGSIVGGVRLGMFTAAFCGLQNLITDKRGVQDVFNIAGAGAATAAMFGLILPGSMMWRARKRRTWLSPWSWHLFPSWLGTIETHGDGK
ncbi:Uncharacterized protein M6B38_213865 [Iris pallida]|uniref:Complex I assembly factor TIMMDC1, mitochondrial n=1 Tax=Iris pallida TaxID=29817 RepID=A0AAX6E2K8_IRIPA|nr:Uncharacterized protein M6B38_213865 [Iris pallida]